MWTKREAFGLRPVTFFFLPVHGSTAFDMTSETVQVQMERAAPPLWSVLNAVIDDDASVSLAASSGKVHVRRIIPHP